MELKRKIFEEPTHLCECRRPIGKGFWCDHCGGWLEEKRSDTGWIYWLVVAILLTTTFYNLIVLVP